MKRPARAVAAFAAAALLAAVAPSCAETTLGGTDSNTHWLVKCDTDSDCGSLACLCGVCTKACSDATACAGVGAGAVCAAASSDCSAAAPRVCARCGTAPGLVPCPASNDAAAGVTGGTCPASAVENEPCDGSVEQCWTPCSNGLRGQYACSDGKWGAGKGVFSCGDAGSSAVDGVCPPDVGPGVPCSGSGQCATSCAGGGYQTYWSCTDGQWVGTFDLMPCPDAAAPLGDVACPANVASGVPCDSSVPICAARCVSGLQGRFYCEGGQWLAGHGLFPCGDAG